MTQPLSLLSVQRGKANKFRNVPCEVDGIRFDSKKEARRWGELKLMEKVGLVSFLDRQVRYPLRVNGDLITTYVCDFRYIEKGREGVVVEDVKGVQTPEFKLKSKLMKAIHGVEIKLT